MNPWALLSVRFSQQQRKILDDIKNPFKFIIGEAGTGKSYVCMALAKKYIEQLGFHKVFYLIPEHKKACKKFVEKTLRQEFLIDESWDGSYSFLESFRFVPPSPPKLSGCILFAPSDTRDMYIWLDIYIYI